MAILNQDFIFETKQLKRLSCSALRYIFWPQPREFMLENGISDADILEVIQNGNVIGVQKYNRYLVLGEDLDERWLRLIVIPFQEMLTIEIISLNQEVLCSNVQAVER